MSIKEKIIEMRDDPFIGYLAEELDRIHESHGRPEPPDGPSTNVIGAPASLLSASDVGDWEGMEEKAADKYNDAIEELLSAADYVHCGSGVWMTQYNKGSKEWQEYKEEAGNVIREWIARDAWDRFCDDPYGFWLQKTK